MTEFKTISFVIFDEAGKAHRVGMDIQGGERPSYELRGDPALLLDRWDLISRRIELYLKGQLK